MSIRPTPAPRHGHGPVVSRRTDGQGAKRRGSALLTVLWLSAALSAIAFAMSMTVRGETERTATAVDDLRSYYLAASGVERAAMEQLWSAYGSRKFIPPGAPSIDYDFPSGTAHVEIISEAGKLNVNKASVEELYKLLIALGVEAGRAGTIAAAIVDWRSPSANGSSFDSYYLSATPSFQAPHASFQEIEELLSVRGVTPDIYYGTWAPAEGSDPSKAALVRHAGLNDCLTVYMPAGGGNVNAADPRAMATGGSRNAGPIYHGSIFTFRSTARLRLANGQFSDMRRTVGAEVKYVLQPTEISYQVLRWYDTAWSF